MGRRLKLHALNRRDHLLRLAVESPPWQLNGHRWW
jgi:hypothetical protein